MQSSQSVREGVRRYVLPEIDIRDIVRSSDEVGIFAEHVFGIPDRTGGYQTRDNASALVIAARAARLGSDGESTVILERSFSFLVHALDRESGWYRSSLGYDRAWIPQAPSPTAHAPVLRALGETSALVDERRYRDLSIAYLKLGLPRLADTTSTTALAIAAIGIDAMLGVHESSDLYSALESLALRIDADPTGERGGSKGVRMARRAHVAAARIAIGERLGRDRAVAEGMEAVEALLADEEVASHDGAVAAIVEAAARGIAAGGAHLIAPAWQLLDRRLSNDTLSTAASGRTATILARLSAITALRLVAGGGSGVRRRALFQRLY